MRHAVLGAGGIGGLIAAALARSGADVRLLLRSDSVASYGGRLHIDSVVLGEFTVDVPAVERFEGGVDVLWVATKATQLQAALTLAPSKEVGEAAVVPLLNGVDHLKALRDRYENVIAAAIRVESERAAGGVIRQTSPFLRMDVAGAEDVQRELRRAGVDCRSRDDEATMLWEKLVFLAPIALATTAFDAPLGSVRDEPTFVGCREEAAAAARAAGADVDIAEVAALHEAAPAQMRSSMQKDVAARREPELRAIAGPIQRLAHEHGFEATSTNALAALISERLS
jgi:2-dehydropantoate 2-reductase